MSSKYYPLLETFLHLQRRTSYSKVTKRHQNDKLAVLSKHNSRHQKHADTLQKQRKQVFGSLTSNQYLQASYHINYAVCLLCKTKRLAKKLSTLGNILPIAKASKLFESDKRTPKRQIGSALKREKHNSRHQKHVDTIQKQRKQQNRPSYKAILTDKKILIIRSKTTSLECQNLT